MFRAALRNVLGHKARLVMTMLAVLLGVSFVSGTLVFSNTISDAYIGSSEQSFDHVDVRIRPTDRGRLLEQELLERARAVPGAGSASGVVSGFTALAGNDRQIVGDDRVTTGANYSSRYSIADGRAPTAEGEVAIDARTAERTGHRVGDSVRISVSGPVLEERVTGIFDTDDGNVAAGGTLVLFDTATAQRLLAEPAHYNQIDLTAESGTSAERLRQEARNILPHGVEVVTAAQLVAEQADENGEAFRTLSQVLLACAGIALFVGSFLIANTFTMLVAQRTQELALLRAVGASRSQVTRSVLVEAALVGLIASAAGLAAGIGVGAGVRAVLSATDDSLPDGPLVVSATTILAAVGLGFGVTLLAAWLPARRAARIPPVAAMSSVHAQATTRSLVVRNAIGALLAAVGGTLAIAATSMANGELWLGTGAALLLIGVFVLTPLLSRPVIAAAGPALRRFGVSGKLAGQNAVRNPRRTAATASAITVGLMLIAGLSVLATSASKATEALADADFLRADYIVSMANSGPLTPGAEKTLSELDEVTASSPARATHQIRLDGTDQPVTGFETEDIDELLALGFIEGSFAPGDTAVVDRATAIANGWRMGDTLPVVWPDDARGELEITGIYHSDYDNGVKTDVSVIDPHLDRIADEEVFVKTEGGASEAMRRTLQTALGNSPAIRIQDKQDLVDEITGAINIVLNLLYGMLALALLVAVLGVVNTLAMSVHERSQEIGLLRAIGLDRAGVKLMVRLESVAISLLGGVLGVSLGVFVGWAIGELVAASGVDTWTLAVPWGRLAILLVAAAVVGVVAAVWPARRAARLNLLDAIRVE